MKITLSILAVLAVGVSAFAGPGPKHPKKPKVTIVKPGKVKIVKPKAVKTNVKVKKTK